MERQQHSLLEVLRNNFKLAAFRHPQQEICEHVLKGESALVLLSTGGGKSLCFQIPALVKAGVCLVISPLISLMQDQVQALRSKGVDARYLSSSNDASINKQTLRDLSSQTPQTKILYITPERLNNQDFLRILKGLDQRSLLSLLAVDESHCISSWGHDFRSSFRKLGAMRDHFPSLPILALTATATKKVQTDILAQLKIPNAKIFRASFNRPNIHLSVQYKATLSDSMTKLVVLIKKHLVVLPSKQEGSCIIYCWKKSECDAVAKVLNKEGLTALVYHADLKDSQRQAAQASFISGSVRIVVATVSFGMGIDKSDVRLIIHWTIPQSIEGFFQEIGRGGRDGKPSASVLFYDRSDSRGRQSVINKGENAERSLEKLEQMVHYCELSDGCRRKYILEFFGERYQRPTDFEKKKCCDYCLDGGQAVRARLQHMLTTGMRSFPTSSFSRARCGGGGSEDDDGKGGAPSSVFDNEEEEEAKEEEEGAESQDAEVDTAVLTTGTAFKHRIQAAQRPGLSQQDQARAVLKAFVAAEEEEEEIEEEEAGRGGMMNAVKRGPRPPQQHIVPKRSGAGGGGGHAFPSAAALKAAERGGLKRPRPLMMRGANISSCSLNGLMTKKTTTMGGGGISSTGSGSNRLAGSMHRKKTSTSTTVGGASTTDSNGGSLAGSMQKETPATSTTAAPAAATFVLNNLAEFEALDEEEGEGLTTSSNPFNVSVERRRKVIKEIYKGSVDSSMGQREKEAALKQIRELEHEWYIESEEKAIYQGKVEGYLEGLYNT